MERVRRAEGALFLPEIHPRAVSPCIPGEICRNGGRLRPELRGKSVRIRLQEHAPVCSLDLIFIDSAGGNAGDKDLEYAGIPDPSHLVPPPVPVVELSHHRNAHGVRRPHGKADARDTGTFIRMRSEELPYSGVISRRELLKILLLPDGRKGIGILCLRDSIVRVRVPQPVRNLSGIPDQTGEKSALVFPVHLHGLSGLREDCLHPYCLWHKGLDQKPLPDDMRSQDSKRIRRFRIHDLFHRCPIHQIIQFLIHTSTSRLLLLPELFPGSVRIPKDLLRKRALALPVRK